MKRVTLWIDSKDQSVEQVLEILEGLLAELGLRYKIVDTSKLIESESE